MSIEARYIFNARKVTTGLGVEYRAASAVTWYSLRELKRWAREHHFLALSILEQTAQRVIIRDYDLVTNAAPTVSKAHR